MMIRRIYDRCAEHPRRFRHAMLLVFCVGSASFAFSKLAPRLVGRDIPLLRMGAGPKMTRRFEIATYLAKEAARHQVFLETEANAGTEECLEQLKAGKLDLAIVSSGVVVPEDDDLMVLGALNVEALHLLVRKDMADTSSIGESIRGKRINIGIPGSTEQRLARDFLGYVHLRASTATRPGDVELTGFSKVELAEKARAIGRAEGPAREALIADLPDCVFLLDSTPATVAQMLIEFADYRLLPVHAARAYIADSLQESRAAQTVLLREFLEPSTILPRSYFGRKGYPEEDCETVGVRLLLVARKDLPARAVRPLMETLFEGEFARRIRSKSPRELPTSYAIHPGAVAYLDRDKPLPINDLIDWLKEVFSVFGALSALALSLYGLLWRRKSRKPSDYIAAIRQIERLAQGAEVDFGAPRHPSDLLRHLDDRLHQLRLDLMEDICEGRIKGDQAITNILALLNEARTHLHRGVSIPWRSSRHRAA